MLDQTKYEHIEVELPNIFVVWEVGRDKTGVVFGIDKDIKEFVMQAAMKFPMWRFVSSGLSKGRVTLDGKEVPTIDGYRFRVYEDREKIGEINTDYSRAHGKIYSVTNERIKSTRERGSAAKTKDLNKALKLLAKNFGAKTIHERLNEANGKCGNSLHMVCNDKSRTFINGYYELTNHMTHHLMTNWETTRQCAKDSGADLTKLDTLPSAYEDHMIAKEVEKCYENGNGAVVTIHGKDYAVKEEKCVTIYGTDNLPAWIKRGVGMLKLVEDNTLIGKVGFKISEQSFFVMKEKENE